VRTALYPGSFDPLHNGHVDVVEQAARLFDRVVLAVMVNPQKPSGRFSLEDRMAMARESIAHIANAEVQHHAGLAVDAALAAGAAVFVKGLRTAGDFEVEMQMAHTNESVSGIPTVFVPTNPSLSFLSSRFIREIAAAGRDVSHLVPAPVARRMKDALR